MVTNYDFNEEAYWQYKDEVNNSGGFHVLSDYGLQMRGGIFHVGEDSQAFQKAVAAARFAVEEYNEKESEELEFLQILNVNVEPSAGSIYYITLEAREPSHEVIKQYHAKVWSKISNRFQLQMFMVAPYAAKDTGMTNEDDCCCVRIDNLQPWMDENYLYYKCFFTAKELVSIQVIRKKPEGHAFLQFKSRTEAEKVIASYDEKLMPSANNVYKLDLVQFKS